MKRLQVPLSSNELIEIFEAQYNDIFSDILKIEQMDFFKALMQQIMLYLDITKKYSPQVLLKKEREGEILETPDTERYARKRKLKEDRKEHLIQMNMLCTKH